MQKLSSKLNIGVGLAMILMIIPSFFTSSSHNLADINRKIDVNVSSSKQVSRDTIYWKSIPENAVAKSAIIQYKDANLTHKVGQIKPNTELEIDKLKNNSFELTNGNYISASKTLVSDLVSSVKIENITAYTKGTVKVFYNPFTASDQSIVTTLAPNLALRIDKIAQTNWGDYYEVLLSDGQKGWVEVSETTLENPKLIQVQTLLNQKYNKSNYSIYVKLLDSKFTVGVNQTKQMYSASLSKIPILYWTQKRLNEGTANLSDGLLYTDKINSFYGAFQPAGTGNIPKTANNIIYNLQDVINRTAKLSDNVGSNLLAYYETGQFSPTFQNEITKIAGQPWNPKTRLASSEMVGKVLEALYNEGGASFDALFNTNFDNIKIQAGLPSNVSVAHKIGSAGSDNHDAAIVFSSQPYVLVIETEGGSDELIEQISKDVYEVLK